MGAHCWRNSDCFTNSDELFNVRPHRKNVVSFTYSVNVYECPYTMKILGSYMIGDDGYALPDCGDEELGGATSEGVDIASSSFPSAKNQSLIEPVGL